MSSNADNPRSADERRKRSIHPVVFAAVACCSILSLLLGTASQADPRLPHLFSNHMVLQRDAEIAIWGWADPGEKITVTLGNARGEATASSDGRWRVTLGAMPAGGPFTLMIQGTHTVALRDVLLGEVWLASGQSNMAYALSNATGAAEEIPKANYPEIRFFTVPEKIALAPQEDTLTANWKLCTPESAKTFSAVSYYFARSLYRDLNVPIGIISSVWSGSLGEEWSSPKSLELDPELRPILERWNDSPSDVKSFAAGATPISLEFDDFELLPKLKTAKPLLISNFNEGNVRTSAGGDWIYDFEAAPSTFLELGSPGRGANGFSVRIFGTLDGASSSRWAASFQRDNSPADLSANEGVRFWARGHGAFQLQTIQPTISDWDNYSSELIRATADWKEIVVPFAGLKQAGWGVPAPFSANALNGLQILSMAEVGNPSHPPSGLYEGMIAPLLSYRIRGAIWYQGEGNTSRAEQYRKLLPALIQSWRDGFNEGNFPFLIVQLPNHGSSPELGNSTWAELREAQFLTAKRVANTGLAVTIDVGSPQNLHPPQKEPVGRRLALWALGTTYGKKIVYSGPLFEQFRVEGARVRTHFRFAGSGLAAHGGAVLGFSIAGPDRVFHRAEARIEGADVLVSSSEVPSPVAVRYGWSNSPSCNLYNQENLPASPFRTDDWPVQSTGVR